MWLFIFCFITYIENRIKINGEGETSPWVNNIKELAIYFENLRDLLFFR